jgi:signal transduction histidine kinase
MAHLDSGASLARLADGCARIRAAARPDDVLDVVAEEARALAGAKHAWAARLEGTTVASLRSTTDPSAPAGDAAAPPLAALLAGGRPVARAHGFVGVALFGSSSAPEGIVAFPRAAGADDAVLELALAQLAVAAGLALEASRLRSRVEAVTRAREALLASVSHDLRNPLNTFAMSAGLLRDDLERNDVDATRGISLVSRMERATARMQGLIEDLVEASRIDARKIDYAIREERAGQLVKDAATAATPIASEKGAAVAIDSVDDDVRVMADRARTLQLISKVIAFEAKSTGDGGTIRLGVARDGDAALFTARAIGPGGMPVPAPEEGRGGLALLIARGLVEAQHGTFRIEPGDGLVVAFTLPAAKP